MVSISTGKPRGPSGDYASIPLSGLRAGATLRSPIFEDCDDRNILLLSAGTKLTIPLLEKLKQRNVTRVRVHRSELSRVAGTNGEGPAAGGGSVRDRGERSRNAPTPAAISNAQLQSALQPRGRTPFNRELVNALKGSGQKSVAQLNSLLHGLAVGVTEGSQAVVDLSKQSIQQMTADLDLFVSLGIVPSGDSYPGQHSIQVAKLAVAMGAVMGLSLDSLMELSLGCLIHDTGMLRINRDLFTTQRKLRQIEFLEITKHPAITFELVRDVSHLTTGARMVAYQMHERWNGTGYPRQRHGKNIHPLARIASVADVYIALVSPRPHRPGMLPYKAVEEVLKGARNGIFDPEAVRGLLKTVSLFPVGSYIETSDARVGQVMRSNRELFARPVVQLWTPDSLWGEPEIVDLAEVSDVAVVRALDELPVTQPALVPDSASIDDWE